MADLIYNKQGVPKGVRLGKFLYDLEGEPIGRVSSDGAYRLDGTYVGELFKGMVVKKGPPKRPLPPSDEVPEPIPPHSDSRSRTPVESDFEEVFDQLLNVNLAD